MAKHCTICGKVINKHTKRTIVCRGKYLGQRRFKRSECDLVVRRQRKLDYTIDYSKRGKYNTPADKTKYWNKCLKCDTMFDAESRYNRRCGRCSAEDHLVSSRRYRVASYSNRKEGGE